jgi:hypothetical protein
MITLMPTTVRPQQRYDHQLRHLVHCTGDVTVATDLGVPRSTARGWLGPASAVVVSLDVADLTEPELRQEVLKLCRRVQTLTALLRLALALLRTSGFCLTGERLPDGRARSGSCAPSIARPLLLSSHVTVSTDVPRDPGDPRHGHLARLSARPDRHPRRPCPAARHGLGLTLLTM